MVYRIPLHRTGKAIQFLLQAVLLHYIDKIHANFLWDLNSLTLSIEPEHVYQYCTRNIAAWRKHIQFYYKSIAFYSAYVYRIEKYCIAAKIFNTYRIVRHAYRYTPIMDIYIHCIQKCTSWSINLPLSHRYCGTFTGVKRMVNTKFFGCATEKWI